MKKIIPLLLAIAMLLGCASAAAEWPDKPITVLIPANPGGDTDTTSRAISQSLTEILGQPVSVVNMSGGAGTIAMNELMARDADGYTLIYHHVDTVLLNLLGRMEEPWTDMLDVSSVTGGGATFCVLTHKDSPYQTWDEMIAYVKDHPGEVNFAMEAGGTLHMLILAIEEALDIQFNAVDLGSASDRNTALLGKQCDLVIAQYGQVIDYIKNGDFVPLCVLAEERNENFADLPSSYELGCPVACNWWYYFGFKKGTDPAIVSKFTEAVGQAVAMQPYTDALALYNYKANFRAGEDAVAYMKETEDFFRPITEMLTNP